jgi:hypothetical protein
LQLFAPLLAKNGKRRGGKGEKEGLTKKEKCGIVKTGNP